MGQSFKLLDHEGPPQSRKARAKSVPPATSLEFKSDPRFSKQHRSLVAQEVRRKYVRCSHEATKQSAENDLSNLFSTSTAEIEKEIKNACYQYTETILTAMTEKRTLDEVLDGSIHHWTQSALFMDASVRRAINTHCFTRPVENFVRLCMDKSAKKRHMLAKVKAIPPSKLSDL